MKLERLFLFVFLFAAVVLNACGKTESEKPPKKADAPEKETKFTSLFSGKEKANNSSSASAEKYAMEFVFSSTGPVARTYQWRGFPLLEDIDGNGLLDIVATTRKPPEINSVHVFLQTDKGKWESVEEGAPAYRCYGCAKMADLNGDGRKDFVLSGHTSMSAFLCDKPLSWRTLYKGGFRSVGLASHDIGDINGDGNVDVVGLSENPHLGIQVYFGDGQGGFKESPGKGLPEVGAGTRIYLKDVNKDGYLDIIAALQGPKVYLGDGGKTWTGRHSSLPVSSQGLARDIDAADFNRDGKLDLVFACRSVNMPGLEVFLYDEKNEWRQSNKGLNSDQNHSCLKAGDMNNDGIPDIVVSTDDSVEIYLGDGKGSWTLAGKISMKGYSWGLTLGDINQDGLLDILNVVPHRTGVAKDRTGENGLLGVWIQKK